MWQARTVTEPIALLSHAHGLPLVVLARSVAAKNGIEYIADRPVPKKLFGSFRGLRGRAASAHVLDAAPLLLRRSAVKSLLAELDRKDARLVSVSLCDGDVIYDEDWVLVHPLKTFAVDRRVGKQRTFVWREPPIAPLFRIAEYPNIVCAQRSVYQRLHVATKKKIVEALPPYTHPNPKFYPLTLR